MRNHLSFYFFFSFFSWLTSKMMDGEKKKRTIHRQPRVVVMVTPKILDSSRQSRFPQWAESARRFIRIQPPPPPSPSPLLLFPLLIWRGTMQDILGRKLAWEVQQRIVISCCCSLCSSNAIVSSFVRVYMHIFFPPAPYVYYYTVHNTWISI